MTERDLTISQLAAAVGVPVSTIRYYERRDLLRAKRRNKGDYRRYDSIAVATMRFIVSAKTVGFTLAETRQLLASRVSSDCSTVEPLVRRRLATMRRQIAELREQEQRLIQLAGRCLDFGRARCEVMGALRGSQASPP